MSDWYAAYESDCALLGEAVAEREWFGPRRIGKPVQPDLTRGTRLLATIDAILEHKPYSIIPSSKSRAKFNEDEKRCA